MKLEVRLERWLRGELDPREREVLLREAELDPALGREVEALAPFSGAELERFARLGSASLKTRRRQRAIFALASSAVAGLCGAVWLVRADREVARYQLSVAGHATEPIAFDTPLAFTISPLSTDRGDRLELYAAVDGERGRVIVPVRTREDGAFEIRGPAHRLTGGRYGTVELDFLIAGGAPLKDTLTLAPPRYEVAFLDRRGPQLRSAPSSAAIEVRPHVAVRGGLSARLYAVDRDGNVSPTAIEPKPVGADGVLRFELADPVERVARWIVAVGPKRAELAPEQLLSPAPPGWWIGTISKER